MDTLISVTMAQLERLSKSSEYSRSPQAHNRPTFEQHFQGEVSNGLLSSSSHMYDHEDHNKKSVLMKVKEKAKKLGRSLSGKKKQGLGSYDDNTSPSMGAKLEDAAEDNEDPEYLGAPMYESELAPESLKETSRQHPRANPVVPGNHSLSSCLNTEDKQAKETPATSKQETEKHISTHSLAPKNTFLTITNPSEQETEPHFGGTHVATSATTGSGRFNDNNGLNFSQMRSENRQRFANRSQKWDTDEKSLSQVISDSLSPRKSPGHGVVEKVREAVSSFLWHDEESHPTIKNTDKSSPSSSSPRKPQSSRVYYTTNPISSPKNAVGNRMNPSPNVSVPTSTNEVVEEQAHGRILQMN